MAEPHPRDTEYECPACGEYYGLSITAPPAPEYLDDAQAQAWDEQHDNMLRCAYCGWRSDEEG